MTRFQTLVWRELADAREKYPTPFRSLHEAYAVLLEEVEEFWIVVREKNQSEEAALTELTQIAAMAQRAAEDLQMVPRHRCGEDTCQRLKESERRE